MLWQLIRYKLLLWTQVFSIAYFCNKFLPSASTHAHVQEKHQEESLQDRQHWVFGQYAGICIISVLQSMCIFLYLNNQAILQPIEGVLPQVYQTSFSSPCTYTFHKFSINYQWSDWRVASLEQVDTICQRITIFFFLFKDSELNELRKTIELLKKQNAAAQAAINGVINTPELNCKGEKRALHLASVRCSWDFRPLGNIWCNHQRSVLFHDCALVTCFGVTWGFEMSICVNSAISSAEANGCVRHEKAL